MGKVYRILFLLLFVSALSTQVLAQDRLHRASSPRHRHPDPATLWADSVFRSMSLEQKVAQLMIIRVPLNMDAKAQAKFEKLLTDTEVGGVCFFVGTAKRQLELTRSFQRQARVPLMVCLDAEWGLGMRLKDCFSFPKQVEFGKLPHEMDSLVYRMGVEIGRQCKNMGIHVNFAPVVDINSNPKNPVIGPRSFGTDRERVAQLGIMYAKGLQSQGVMAVAKHFPGHGDTDADSHFELPVINHTREYMDSIDLYPFAKLINAGVEGVMTAHLQVNAYESEPNHPSSLSAALVNDVLRKKLRFGGLVFTDGLDMKGVTKYYKDGDESLQALLAGNDMLLLPPDVPCAIQTICAAAEGDRDLQKLIDIRCRRVLRSKYLHGCANMNPQSWHLPTTEDSLRCDRIVKVLSLNNESKIDSIINDGIAQKAFPGCQVLMMQGGELVFCKAYGHQTYDSTSAAVTMGTVYDLASVTKMVSTTLAVMKLVDAGKVKLDDPLSRYLPYLKNTDKSAITLRQALSHMARLKDFDAFWRQAQKAEDPRASVISQIAGSALYKDNKYVYSDLGFILLGDMVEHVTGQTLDLFVRNTFYEPMGLCHTYYNPLEHGIDADSIAPTENDTHYRNRQLRGTVHDENADAMGGVSGHAGLFSTAQDLSRVLSMLLNQGVYDGRRYLSANVIKTFNHRYFDKRGCRRALGFDKPLLGKAGSTTAAEVSQQSFGHTGFTGTMVWVDPENQSIFIFLSNRVYPNTKPNKLAQMDIRTKVQSELYRCLSSAAAKESGVASFGN